MARVLIVEDSEDNRRILRDLLASAGFIVEEAVDGEAGLDAARRVRPDLIITDIQLPRLDGHGLARALRRDEVFQAVPIIAVTSFALLGDEEKARDAGCDAYVPKPFSPRQLLVTVRRLLEHRRE